ncbi:hypothetical protein BMS3Abin07_02324 [bacterium BMS3Abin07]|nr:hypothetical protein BMS3Abin07_02324 [bacterium BMS3Abin07]
MIEAKAEVEIRATPENIWNYMVRLDDWWLRSNPNEHIELSLIDTDKIEEGTRFILKEYIAGVRGEAVAEIKRLVPMQRLIWQSTQATYKLFGITFNVDEGGIFELTNKDGFCVLSHHVWGKPRLPVIGWLVEVFFKYVIEGEKKDYEHTYRELQFIKNEIEAQNA